MNESINENSIPLPPPPGETDLKYLKNQSREYLESCLKDAKKPQYFDVGGVLVVIMHNTTGTASHRYGWKDGKWVLGYPSYEMFYNEGQRIDEQRAQQMLSSEPQHIKGSRIP